jgi:transposase
MLKKYLPRRKFDREFKLQAVKMVLEEHLPVNEVARRLNVSENQIHAWKQTFKESGPVAFPGKGHLAIEADEIRQLKKRLADAEEERDILKKALGIFSKTREGSTNL